MITSKKIYLGLIFVFFTNQIIAGIPGAMLDCERTPISIAVAKDINGRPSWFYISNKRFNPFSYMAGHPFLGRLIQTSEDEHIRGRILFTITPMDIPKKNQANKNIYKNRVKFDSNTGLYIQRVKFDNILNASQNEIDQELFEQMKNNGDFVDLRVCLQIPVDMELSTRCAFSSFDELEPGIVEVAYESQYANIDYENMKNIISRVYRDDFVQIETDNAYDFWQYKNPVLFIGAIGITYYALNAISGYF